MKRDWNDRLRAGEQIDPDAPGELLEQAPLPEGDEGASPVEDLRLPWRTVGSWGELDGQDWLNVEAPPRSWLLTNPGTPNGGHVLSRGIVGVLASAGGVGKTFALLELAVLVAGGGTRLARRRFWLDTMQVHGGGRVLFVAGEEAADELRRRLFSVVKRMCPPLDGELPFQQLEQTKRDQDDLKGRVRDRLVVVPTVGLPDLALLDADAGGNLHPSARHAEIVKRLKEGEEPWDLVVVDPMIRFATGEIDKDNQAASALIGAFEAFVKAGAREGHPGPAVLVAHHTSKESRKEGDNLPPAATDVRGASAITDNARWVAAMRPGPSLGDRESVAFSVVKSNYGSKPSFSLVRDESGLLRAQTLEEQSLAKQRAQAAFVQANVAAGVQQQIARDAKQHGAQIVKNQPALAAPDPLDPP